MSNEFTASNGNQVRQSPEHGRIEVRYGTNARWLVPGAVDTYGGFAPISPNGAAVFEYLRHLEDERLERWRSKERPDWTAVAVGPNIVFTSDLGNSFKLPSNQAESTYSVHLRDEERAEIAREYRGSFPERLWERAKPGEVWELTPNYAYNPELSVPRVAAAEDGGVIPGHRLNIVFRFADNGDVLYADSGVIVSGRPLHTRKLPAF